MEKETLLSVSQRAHLRNLFGSVSLRTESNEKIWIGYEIWI
jgi:hypothetical protein